MFKSVENGDFMRFKKGGARVFKNGLFYREFLEAKHQRNTKINEMRIGRFSLVMEWQNYPEFVWGMNKTPKEARETGPHEMAEASPQQKVVTRRFLSRY